MPRRNPWEVARQAVTIDHLSRGRLILGLGLGSDATREYSAFGRQTGTAALAQMLLEGLQVITGLWTGEPFSFSGEHYRLETVRFLPRPLQMPRIPIWLAGTWPRLQPFRRAAAWEGAVPVKGGDRMTPEDIASLRQVIAEERGDSPFDVMVTDWHEEQSERDLVRHAREFAEAGATWYQLSLAANLTPAQLRDQIRIGPPRS